MENTRLILFSALAIVLFLMYQEWQKDYPPQGPAAPAYSEQTAGTSSTALTDDIPALGAAGIAEASAADAGAASAPASGGRVRVTTDVFQVEIDLAGGDFRQVLLLDYPEFKTSPDRKLAFLNDAQPNFFIVNSGLVSGQSVAPDHQTQYTSGQQSYELAEGRDDLLVPLHWSDDAGHSVTKVYRFRRNSYEIELLYTVNNAGDSEWVVSPYVRFWRTPHKPGGEPPFVQSFLGVAVYEQDDDGKFKFRKHEWDNLGEKPVALEQQGGWTAMLQHYFLAAILPPAEETNRFYARPSKNFGFLTEYVGPRRSVEPGAQAELPVRLFIGPKLQQSLEEVAPGLHLTVDYGLLTPISEPLFWVLEKIHRLTGNWGWAIVLLTVLIKGAFYKLSEAQYRSMARMKKFAPRIQALKERYADDRERLHKSMMELYQKEGFNPLAGCWPMLVQFPVFIALYWVLLESVELRQADFFLWINNLSSPDPYYVLPVLFGISMFLQQKLSGQAMTMEPMQQRIMNIMPIALTVFFAFFPVGLVVYWFVSNVIGIAQQWYITRKLDREEAAKPHR